MVAQSRRRCITLLLLLVVPRPLPSRPLRLLPLPLRFCPPDG